MAIAISAPVPEAREKIAGGATTGQRPRNTNRALKGREKATRSLAGNIAGGIRTLLAPLPGRIPNRGWWAIRFRWFPVATRPSPPANLFRASGSPESVVFDSPGIKVRAQRFLQSIQIGADCATVFD